MTSLNTLPTEILRKIIDYVPGRPFKTELLLISRTLCRVLMTEQVKILELNHRRIHYWIAVVTDGDMKRSYSIPSYANLLDKVYKLFIYTHQLRLPEEAVAGFISRCTNLRKLVFASTSLKLGPIFDTLTSNIIETNLMGMTISNLDERHQSLVSLVECVKRSTELTKLCVDKAGLGDNGARALGECLKQNSTIKELILPRNRISSEGARFLAEGLKHNAALVNMELYDNNIDNEGAHALAECLKQNTALTHLHLEHNCIGDEGAQALIECLKWNTTLTNLYLKHNKISINGIHTLTECLKQNTTRTNLDIFCIYGLNV